MYDDKADAYAGQVWSPTAAAFLMDRGLAHSTIHRFRLGYVDVPFKEDRKRKGCLTIPYEDGMGRVRQIRYRPLFKSDAKYLTVAGEKAHLFAVRAADNPRVCVAEGEIDAMTLWQVGLKAVGLPGAQSWKDEWRWLFRNCERVTLCLDPDDAGFRAAQRLYQGLSTITDVDVVKFPPDMDVNDFYRKYGADALREVVG